MPTTVNDICDYVVTRLGEAGEEPSLLKVQKLLYYGQAWHLAFYETRLFEGDFQAWIHGPVNRRTYDRYRTTKMLYSTVGLGDRDAAFDATRIPEAARDHVDGVLEVYGRYSGTELEHLTHHEDPWVDARAGYAPDQRCEVVIPDTAMRDFYGRQVATA